MLRARNITNYLKNNKLYDRVAEFCGFSHVNMN